jgi:hypothetical protein
MTRCIDHRFCRALIQCKVGESMFGTQLFQTSKVIAAILRARVSRAMDGFIPLATKAA